MAALGQRIQRGQMRLLRSVFLLIVMGSVAQAQAPSKSDPEGFGKRTLQLFDAMKAQDVKAIDAMLAPHFLFTSFVGATGMRAQYLDVFAKKLMTIDSFKLNPIGVEMYGDTAVVVYRCAIKAQVGNQPWPGELVSTDTWVKLKGAWKLAARHSSAIATAR
jgi:ketosteroid isomerase-like protein